MEKERLWVIMKEADESLGGSIDMNLAASGLKQAAERYLVLLESPGRPIQAQYEMIVRGNG